MNGNTELLNFICKNSEMGTTTIKQLKDITDDAHFKAQLESQFDEYQAINSAAKGLILKSGQEKKGLSTMEKMRASIMISMQTLKDKSPSHIAEMLIIGSNMGILEATKKLKQYSDAEDDIKGLMARLLKLTESNVQNLKNFL